MYATGFKSMLMALPCAAALAATASGAAQVFQLADEQRSIQSFVIVPPCPPGTIGDEESAEGIDPFNSVVSSGLMCEAAGAEASAEQDSFVEGVMLASGGSTATASSGIHIVIHSISNSYYEVTFEVLQPALFTLSAELAAAGAAPVVLCGSEARLTRAGGAVIFHHTVEPLPGGEPNSETIKQSGQLLPGAYTFRAQSSTVIDSSFEPGEEGNGDASFDVQLDITLLADLNSDGAIDGADLGVLLLAWGACPRGGDCPADLDFDGEIDGSDLGLLLLNWTG